MNRVAIFSALYMPHLGGVEKYSQSIAAELSKTCEAVVFCCNTEGEPSIKKEGAVTVYSLPCIPMQNGRFPIPLPRAFRITREAYSKEPFDFAIVQCRFYLLSLWAVLWLSATGIPFIQMEHGAGNIRMDSPIVDAIWHGYENILTAIEKTRPHPFYAVSQAAIRWLGHFGIQGAGVLSNSVNPADFTDALEDPSRWRDAHKIPADALLISFTGRIMADKGITDLLRAFDGLERDRVYLVVAGDGDMELVKDWRDRPNILFTGQVDFADIPYILSGTQIFCLPSRFIEGQPTVILEAGCCGVPVVATANGGIPEVVTDGECGILVPAEDVHALRDALRALIDHPDLRKSYGSALRQRVLNHFTWEITAEKIRRIMEETLN